MQHHLLDGRLQRRTHILGLDGHFLGLLGVHVLTGDDHVALATVLEGKDGADLDLDDLGRALADLNAQKVAQMHGNGLVETIAGQTQRAGGHDAAERDDGHLRGTAADVHHHGAGGLGHGQVGTHGRGHGLLDEVGLAGAGLDGGLEHGAFLHRGGAAGNADDDAGLRLPGILPLGGLVDEGRQHRLGHIVVSDHAVFQRMLSRKCVGRVVDHVLRLMTDGQHAMGRLLYGDNRGLVDDDPLAGNGNKGIGSPQVNGHVRRHLTGQAGEHIKE